MRVLLNDRLLKRELGTSPRQYSQVRGIYGDRGWINDLDIVNELNGHSGCVNALSWSKSGNLLASGSDDQFVNIHAYQPEDSANQFSLTTAISTGHTANIFSVKFMPHTNDRTLVTAAGDAEVRIFDIEYSGQTATSTTRSHLASTGRRRGRNNYLHGVRYLSEGDTNARVYRSHGDRVKRIVTESSPHLFLTCSEDGEVRQWDLRLPSSAYPPPRLGRGLGGSSVSDNVPPPLISYKRYDLDLNTISCSPSQPHYIALGGAHLHCFLHDRRMLGRDRLNEMGGGLSPASSRSDQQDELMGRATQCVKKFAPNGQKRMKKIDNGHITACKISDANPNEIVVSWSGDWIYSFDLVRSADAGEEKERVGLGSDRAVKSKESKHRKRKSKPGSVTSREGAARASSQARIETSDSNGDPSSIALRVQYGNGQSEEIPIESPRARSPDTEARVALLPEAQRESYRIAKGTVNVRKTLFSLSEAKEPSAIDPTGHASSFSSVLGHAASLLPDMDEIMKAWRYPMNPHEQDVQFQRTLQRNRASAWRFVQASGTLSRVLGGHIQVAGGQQTLAFQHFSQIRPAPGEGAIITIREQFGYDFVRAILLWLESGVGGVLHGFSVTETLAWRLNKNPGPRYPVPKNATIDVMDEVLIPYLRDLASKRPVIAVDTSRFEIDENRLLFESEEAAVTAFAKAVKIPFEDLSSAVRAPSTSEQQSLGQPAAQDRRTALKFWGLKVARGILMNAAEGVNFAFVDHAFGGLGRPDSGIQKDEQSLDLMSETLDAEFSEEPVQSVEVTRMSANRTELLSKPVPLEDAREALKEELVQDLQPSISDADDEDGEALEAMSVDTSRASEEAVGHGEENMELEDIDDVSSEANEDRDDEEDDEDINSLSNIISTGPFLRRSAYNRRAMRERVERDVPCSPHTRIYRGHCNVRTVKDVNFFGLQDEYIVSGSDSGHVFIWEKKTGQLVNILEGDGEVVNVVQGHPYEPMLAVSGIDHTVKIFSPDVHARENACKGIGVSASDASMFSSISIGRRRPRPNQTAQSQETTTSEPAISNKSTRGDEDDDDEPEIAPHGLSSRKRMNQEYEITSQNDVERRGGNQDVYITRSMLAHLARRLRQRQEGEGGGGGGGGGEGGEGSEGGPGPIVISDDCNVM